LLAVPIRVREGTLGVIELINHASHASPAQPRVDEFTEDDQFFVDLLAQTAAAAFDNARAYAENQARLRVLQTLYEVNAVISSSVSRTEILEQLARQIARAVEAGGTIISGWHENAVSLEPIAHFRADTRLTWEGAPPARNLLADYPLTLEVLRDQVARSVRLDDAQADAAERALLAARGAQAALLMPLVVKNHTIGLIEVLLAQPSRKFSNDEGDLVHAISNEAALAIENALLFEELRARAERLGHAYAELQAADRARRELVSNVAHDLGAPLTFIKGYTELLLGGDLGPLTTEQHEALEVITRKADGLTQLVTDLVILERAERKAPEPVPIDLARLVRDAVRAVEPNAAHNGVTVRAVAPADLPPAHAEAGRISQVLDNLLSNALKFTPSGGTITVTVGEAGAFLQVAVSDTGIGIPAAQQARIFERFYQVGSASGSRGMPGSGLGLSICQAIVTAHGGRIWLESEEGRGSTFYFTLPKA
jgi:signal transduction histidine kinase